MGAMLQRARLTPGVRSSQKWQVYRREAGDLYETGMNTQLKPLAAQHFAAKQGAISRSFFRMRPALRFSITFTLAATLCLPPPRRPRAPVAPITVAPAQGDAKAGHAAHAMVSAANPLAVQTGLRVLAAGGSAVDAAVAVQAVLGLVEPESSGLGGGSFMLFYDAKTKITAYDGREVAPKGADPKQFIGPDGKPLPFGTAVVGGIASGVPGAIAMLEMAQKEHGRLKWGQLFGEARKLAAGGFPVTPKLARNIVSNAPQAKGADAQAYFHKADGSPYLAGEKIVNKAYAHTLDLVAAQGAKGCSPARWRAISWRSSPPAACLPA
jgi:gamma-glutamyltranspeptidase/glutathione hydrolase